MQTDNITYNRLRYLFSYNPDTGKFIRLNSSHKSGALRKGEVGCLSSDGYIKIGVDGVLYQAHRLVWLYMTGKMPKAQLDHINQVRNDNRWCNLREATNQENNRNQTKRKTNTSGVTGVWRFKKNGKWCAEIMVDAKKVWLGYYEDKFNAICARKSAEVKYNFHANHGSDKTEDYTR